MKLGNYELDDIYCGDSAVMLAGLPDASIDLTVTSPPYDSLRSYNGYSWDFTAIATQLYRVTKPGGVVVWVVGDATVNGSETGSSFRQALGFMEIGFNLHDTMIYERHPLPLTHNRYEQYFEYMFVFCKGSPNTFNPIMVASSNGNQKTGGRHTSASAKENSARASVKDYYRIAPTKMSGNIWRYTTGNDEKTAYQHPAVFPEALARDHIISWSNPGDVVLDPFCGSGTTPKLAKTLSRHFIGFDISEEYVTLAKKRVEYAPTPLPLFVENGQPKAEQVNLL